VTRCGDRILAGCAALFGPDAAACIFEPLVADWQHEWHASPRGQSRLRSSIAGAYALVTAALFTAVATASLWHAHPGERRRALRVLGVFTAIGAAILLVPFVKYVGRDRSPLLFMALLPSSLPIALAFALLPALLRIAADAVPARRATARLRAIGVAGIAVALISLCVGWLGPRANQEFRSAASGRTLQPGLRELTLPELWSADARRFGDHAVARERRTRASVAISWPVTLALLGWRLGRRGAHATTRTMAGWWLGAAVCVAVIDPLRTLLGPDVPWLVAPLLWMLVAVVVRPQRDSALAASR
jgi:hypothetical protein